MQLLGTRQIVCLAHTCKSMRHLIFSLLDNYKHQVLPVSKVPGLSLRQSRGLLHDLYGCAMVLDLSAGQQIPSHLSSHLSDHYLSSLTLRADYHTQTIAFYWIPQTLHHVTIHGYYFADASLLSQTRCTLTLIDCDISRIPVDTWLHRPNGQCIRWCRAIIRHGCTIGFVDAYLVYDSGHLVAAERSWWWESGLPIDSVFAQVECLTVTKSHNQRLPILYSKLLTIHQCDQVIPAPRVLDLQLPFTMCDPDPATMPEVKRIWIQWNRVSIVGFANLEAVHFRYTSGLLRLQDNPKLSLVTVDSCVGKLELCHGGQDHVLLIVRNSPDMTFDVPQTTTKRYQRSLSEYMFPGVNVQHIYERARLGAHVI